MVLGCTYPAHNEFFLAMAYWQLGRKVEAHKSYIQAGKSMHDYKSVGQQTHQELRRFAVEAAELLGLPENAVD